MLSYIRGDTQLLCRSFAGDKLLLLLLVTLLLTTVYSTSLTFTVCVKESSESNSYHSKNERRHCNQSISLGGTLEQYIVDNTIVIFCVTNASLQHEVIHISNKTNVSLHGLPHHHTEIHCHGNNSGFEFMNVVNLQVSSMKFSGCGNIVHNIKGTTPWLSGLLFYYCTNVSLSNINVRKSTGSGVAFINNAGFLDVRGSIFESNNIHETIHGGGKCDKYTSDQPYENSASDFSDCETDFSSKDFIKNSKSPLNPHHTNNFPHRSKRKHFECGWGGGLSFYFTNDTILNATNVINVTNCSFVCNRAIYGGGLSLSFVGNTSRNTVMIKHCNFTHNCANSGGGMSIVFDHESRNNSVLIAHTDFIENHAGDGGGGMDIDFLFRHKTLGGNYALFEHCNIVANGAQYGGGITIHYSKVKSEVRKNEIKFNECLWERNTAMFGSAVEASSQVHDALTSGPVLSPEFENCQFLSNYRTEDIHKFQIREGLFANYSWGAGVFLITALSVSFKGNTAFYNNNSSALYLSSSTIMFMTGSEAKFVNNTGYEGGAIALIGLSKLYLSDNNTILFINNTAVERGGAILYRSNNKLDFTSAQSCFIQYSGTTSDVSDRSIVVLFKDNKVGSENKKNGQTIYATTLHPCLRDCSDTSLYRLGCIGNITFAPRDLGQHEISTSGARFVVEEVGIINVIPGKERRLKFKLLDDLDHEIPDSYHVHLLTEQSSIKLDPRYYYITDKKIRLLGKPEDTTDVLVGTLDFRDISLSLRVKMAQCPPGFVTQVNTRENGIECVCSTQSSTKTYVGIRHCKQNDFQAFIKSGYWVGYDGELDNEDSLKSGYCPRGFCFGKGTDKNEKILPNESSKELLNQIICAKYRTGKLCGSCSENSSVFYHSSNYYCFPNKNCGLGLLLYILSELVPVTTLFMIVIFFNIKFTSGTLNGFIFFVQFIDTMLIDANGFISSHQVIDTFTSAYQFVYRMFNLNFFTLDELSFCLWKGATTLDILAFKYVTVVYSLLLVIATVLLKKVCNVSCLKRQRKKKHLMELASSTLKGTMIHGFSAFFVMCYSQCAKVTLFILNPGRIHSMGSPNSNNITTVVFYQGDYPYLQGHHLKYALPASLFGITVVLIPPLLLVAYPLCYKIFALLHIEETRCVHLVCQIMPLERMKPMFDSFQSCFKDKYRFFAGLYFLYRLVALLSFLITDSLTKFYIALEVQLIVMLTLQATTYAYYRRWHNIVDILLFANLATINAMTMYNYKRAKEPIDHIKDINIVSAIQAILISLPFVYMVCFNIILLVCLLYTSPSPRDATLSRMPSSA